MLKSLFTLALFTASVFAQGVDIGLPGQNQTVQRGSDLIVQVQRPVCSTLSAYLSIIPIIPFRLSEHPLWF